MTNADLVRIVQAYYDGVDSHDAGRLASLYLDAPTTALKFNADPAIVSVTGIREFTNQFYQVASVKHAMIDVWTTPLMGDVLPVDMPAERSAGKTITVVSTALPTFTVGQGASAKALALPAASIFTIDVASGKFVSVHNMFDLAQVLSAVNV
ncbi:MAG TPA: hypothetical protein VN158_07475 [Caulobacter sp.]|nr:hypothetical protein [Caulobacter sp.]